MADYTLEDGTEVNFDLSQITMKEWRELHNPAFTEDKDDEVLARVAGVELEKLTSLSFKEYKALFLALVRKMTNPLADPS